MRPDRYRPGPGWFHYPGTAVYGHRPTGARVHLIGQVGLPNGRVITAYSDAPGWTLFLRAAGGNWKRALMAWARHLATAGKET